MKASEFAEYVWGIVVLLGVIIAYLGDGQPGFSVVRLLGVVIVVGSFAWFIMKGQNLGGWVGPSEQRLRDEIEYLERISENWQYPDGSTVPLKKRKAITRRHYNATQSLYQIRAMKRKGDL